MADVAVPTDDMVAEVRRKVAEPTQTTYSDTTIRNYITRYWLADLNGREQFYLQSMAGASQVNIPDPLWIPTYDLNAVAAEIWGEKAASLQGNFDFGADGGNYSVSQKYEQAMKMVRYYRARKALRSQGTKTWPETDKPIDFIDPQNTNQ